MFDNPQLDNEISKKVNNFLNLKLLSGNEIGQDNIKSYIKTHYGDEGLIRYKFANFIMGKLGYRPSLDVMLMLASNKGAKVVIATAGAGKTTSLQIEILIDKMLDKISKEKKYQPLKIEGTEVEIPRILYLNYNRHNVEMISNKHEQMISALNSYLSANDSLDTSLESSTVHSFCHRWLQSKLNPNVDGEINIIPDSIKAEMWNSIIKPRWKKYYEDDLDTVEYTVLDELYSYKVESMCDWDEFFLCAKFIDTGLKSEFVRACIKKYDSMKKQMKLMDFSDYLIKMIEKLKEDEQFKAKLQNRYSLIIADENQDFTRLMNELLLQLYNKDSNRVIIVGDPDQSIYGFRGVSPDNIAVIAGQLEDSEILGLDTNYRCPSNIVELAKKVLAMNQIRFEKPINYVHNGGRIIKHPYESSKEQYREVMEFLYKLNPSDYMDTVVCYRNNKSSVVVAEELYYSNIPFNIIDSRRPFNNMVFKHIRSGLTALQRKDDFELNCKLYRFLPLSREQWVSILQENRKNRRIHLHDIVVSNNLPNGTLECLGMLVQISLKIDEVVTSSYIKSFIALYKVYYFDFLLKQTALKDDAKAEELELYLNRTLKFYSRDYTFEYLMDELASRNKDNIAGVTLSTFHGLKGLEFKHVLAIDFNDNIFPDFTTIEQKYSKATQQEEKEAANRLAYVLFTRTIVELHLFYSKLIPSIYVDLIDEEGDNKDSLPQDELVIEPVSSVNMFDSKLSFVKRILGK